MRKLLNNIPCSDCCNKNGFFCILSEEDKNTLSKIKGSNFYKKGQAIFYEGNQSHGLFCIRKGKVKLSKLGSMGKEQVLRFAKTHDILGYRSLFCNEPYHATAIALEDSYICHISKDTFVELMKSNPKLSWSTAELLSKDLKKAEQHLLNIAQKTVKERIIEALLILHATFGFKDGGNILDISLTRTEIADIAGTTTETTIRMLAQLNKEGLIKLEGRKIIIPNIENLTRAGKIYD